MLRLHLIDATFELFRAHFGSPPRQSQSGQEVGATVGFIASLLALLRDPGVTHVGAATDSVILSFRNTLFDGYKTGAEVDPALLAQFPLAERAVRALGITLWPVLEYEADDAIAAATHRFCNEVDQVVILSPDKDMAQCVDNARIVMFDRRKSVLIDEAGVIAKFGVPPAAIPDYLALVGDTADGIPGLPGWGSKSAGLLLTRYGSLDAIPPDPIDWDVPIRGSAKLAAILQERMPDALLYRDLATLRRDLPIAESLSDLEWRGVPRGPYLELCEELGADTIRDRPHLWAG